MSSIARHLQNVLTIIWTRSDYGFQLQSHLRGHYLGPYLNEFWANTFWLLFVS